jgi:hypothetical protein
MNEIPDKTGLSKLMKEVPSSSIGLVKESPPPLKLKPNINLLNRENWGSRSNQLLDDYKYGEALAKFGETNMSTKVFFKRFSASLCAIISNEYQKRGMGGEELKFLYNILESVIMLISKEIDKKELKDFNISSIIAAMQGFIINYDQSKEIK